MRVWVLMAGLLLAIPAWADGEPAAAESAEATNTAQSTYEQLKRQATDLYAQGEQDLYDHDRWKPLIPVMDHLIALHDEMQNGQPLNEAGKEEVAWLYLTRAKTRFYAGGWPATGPAYEDAMMARKVFGRVPAGQVPEILWEAAVWYEVLVSALPTWGERGKKYQGLISIDKQIYQPDDCPEITYKNKARIQWLMRPAQNWLKKHSEYGYLSQAGGLVYEVNADGKLENIKLHAEAPYPIQGERYTEVPRFLIVKNAAEMPLKCRQNVFSIYALETKSVR